MDRQIVLEKLESLRRCLARIRERCPDSAAALAKDVDAQDIVSVNLTRAVQIAVDIAAHMISATEQPPPTTMGESFELLATAGLIPSGLAESMKSAVGFRNIAIHSYRTIDWAIVFSICTECLADFEVFAEQVMKHLER